MTARQLNRTAYLYPPAKSAPARQATPSVQGVTPCRTEPDLFFSDDDADIEAAKATCSGCPFSRGCLLDALEQEIEYGVWGGATAGERLAMLSGGTKRCVRCEKVQPLCCFHRSADCADGRAYRCKDCERSRDASRDSAARNARRRRQRAARKLATARKAVAA